MLLCDCGTPWTFHVTFFTPILILVMVGQGRVVLAYSARWVDFSSDIDILFALFRVDWWTSAGQELSSWLSACVVLSLIPSLAFDVFVRLMPLHGQDVDFECIGLRSLPFHL